VRNRCRDAKNPWGSKHSRELEANHGSLERRAAGSWTTSSVEEQLRSAQVSPTSASTSYSLLYNSNCTKRSPTLQQLKPRFGPTYSGYRKQQFPGIIGCRFSTERLCPRPHHSTDHGPRTTIHDSISPWTKPSARPPPTSHAFVRAPPGPPAAVPQCRSAALLLLLAPVPPPLPLTLPSSGARQAGRERRGRTPSSSAVGSRAPHRASIRGCARERLSRAWIPPPARVYLESWTARTTRTPFHRPPQPVTLLQRSAVHPSQPPTHLRACSSAAHQLPMPLFPPLLHSVTTPE
jgi:hypothetical protein